MSSLYTSLDLPKSVKVGAHEYYWSTCYRCYIILSPCSGLVGGYVTESGVLSFIERERRVRA